MCNGGMCKRSMRLNERVGGKEPKECVVEAAWKGVLAASD